MVCTFGGASAAAERGLQVGVCKKERKKDLLQAEEIRGPGDRQRAHRTLGKRAFMDGVFGHGSGCQSSWIPLPMDYRALCHGTMLACSWINFVLESIARGSERVVQLPLRYPAE